MIKKIIFALDSPFTEREYERFGVKILPEGIDWHHAGVWVYTLPKYELYRGLNLENI